MLVPSTAANISGKSVRMSIRSAISSRVSIPTNRTSARQLHAAPIVKLFLLRLRRRRLGLAGLGQFQLLVLDAGLLQQRRDGLRRNRSDTQPVGATVELGDELLRRVLVPRIVESELFDHSAVARAAGIDRV